MINALRIIISKSRNATPHAMTTMQAINAKSPVIAQRYLYTVNIALNDTSAEFTNEERQLITSHLSVDGDDSTRSKIVQIRVSPLEWVDLEAMATQAGYSSMAEWTRSLWGIG